MAYEVVPIPGSSTKYDEAPQISVLSSATRRPVVSIQYKASFSDQEGGQVYGEIKFLDVLEYRWVDFDHYYSPYENDDHGEGFELIRILDSQWIETMASKGWFQQYPGQRFGPGVDESRVKHYRISFDDYGVFDVIAFDISIRELRNNSDSKST